MPADYELTQAVDYRGPVKRAYEFEHAVEVGAPAHAAWEFWTNVENWKLDPSIEWVKLDGRFRAGAVGETKQRDQPPMSWRVVEVREAERAVIELKLLYVTFRSEMDFEPVSEGASRLRQRITLDAPADSPFAAGLNEEFGEGVRAGMKKLAEAISAANREP